MRAQSIPTPVRIAVIVIAMVVGAVGMSGFGIFALINYGGGFLSSSPWEFWFTAGATGVLLSLAVPVVAWWYLLPGMRRWCGPVYLVAFGGYLMLVLTGL